MDIFPKCIGSCPYMNFLLWQSVTTHLISLETTGLVLSTFKEPSNVSALCGVPEESRPLWLWLGRAHALTRQVQFVVAVVLPPYNALRAPANSDNVEKKSLNLKHFYFWLLTRFQILWSLNTTHNNSTRCCFYNKNISPHHHQIPPSSTPPPNKNKLHLRNKDSDP